MNSEISTPLNNDMYTEYADVFSFLFRLSTLKLFRFSLLEMYVYNGKVSTTFAPAENSTFALNGWFMHRQCSHNFLVFPLPLPRTHAQSGKTGWFTRMRYAGMPP